MKYQLSYDEFIYEAIDNDKIDGLKSRMRTLNNRLNDEKDPQKRKRLSLEIKVCELKIMIAQIV